MAQDLLSKEESVKNWSPVSPSSKPPKIPMSSLKRHLSMVVTPRDQAEHDTVRTSRALQLLQSLVVAATTNNGSTTITLPQLELLRACMLHQHLDRRASSGAVAIFECTKIFDLHPEIFTSDMRSYLLSSFGTSNKGLSPMEQERALIKPGAALTSVFEAGKALKETDPARFMDPKILYCLSTGSKDTSRLDVSEMSRIIKATDEWGFDVYDAQKVLSAPRRMLFSKHKEKVDFLESNQSGDLSVLVFTGLAAVLRHDGVLDVIAGGRPDQYGKAVSTLARFFRRVGSFYRSNPYHNVEHAADIVQTVNWFLLSPKLTKAMSAKDKLTMIISAAIHDVGHLGVNNDFLIRTGNEHAITYNDQSPLENMHCCLGFKIMKLDGCNIFGQLDNEACKEVRSAIVNLVLATDMKHHFAMVGSIKDKKISFAKAKRKEQLEVMKIMLHAADISNPAKPFPIAKRWAHNIVEEFYNQGDRQRTLGMEISYGHDRFHPVPMPNFQSGFLKGLVLPLFQSLDQAVENLDLTLPLGLLHANVDQWQILMAKMNAEIIEPIHSKHEAKRRVRRSKSLPSTPKCVVPEIDGVNDFPPPPADQPLCKSDD